MSLETLLNTIPAISNRQNDSGLGIYNLICEREKGRNIDELRDGDLRHSKYYARTYLESELYHMVAITSGEIYSVPIGKIIFSLEAKGVRRARARVCMYVCVTQFRENSK